MDWKQLLSYENLELIGTVCGAIAFTIFVSFKTFMAKLDKKLADKKSDIPKVLMKQSASDCEIIKEAENLRELLNADRVQVYEFHNGNHYANGRSALKTTCTYEVCRYSINSCINVLSGVPLSVIPNFLKSLLDNGELLVKDLEEIKNEMPSTYNLKSTIGIKGFYDVIIRNKDCEPVGFVAVQFCEKKINNLNKDSVKRFAWFVEEKLSEL